MVISFLIWFFTAWALALRWQLAQTISIVLLAAISLLCVFDASMGWLIVPNSFLLIVSLLRISTIARASAFGLVVSAALVYHVVEQVPYHAVTPWLAWHIMLVVYLFNGAWVTAALLLSFLAERYWHSSYQPGWLPSVEMCGWWLGHSSVSVALTCLMIVLFYASHHLLYVPSMVLCCANTYIAIRYFRGAINLLGLRLVAMGNLLLGTVQAVLNFLSLGV